MKLNIHEILTLVNDAPTYQERLALIQQHKSLVLEQVLQYNFHPELKFALPEGAAPYKRDTGIPIGMTPTNLYQEGRRLYVFLEGQAPNLSKLKREAIYISMLEGLHYTEADILQAVKDKKLQELYPNVTYELSFQSFDRLLPVAVAKQDIAPLPKKVEVKEEVKVQPVVEQKEVVVSEDPLVPAPAKAKKPKREMTDKWKASLERAAQGRRDKAAAARAAKEAKGD